MFNHLSESIKKIRKSNEEMPITAIFGWQQPAPDCPHIDPEKLESVTALSKLTFESAASHLGKTYRREDEVLVTKISITVILGYPHLPAEQLHHALFAKRMFMEGEYSFAQYIEKMRNLFPVRMENLPDPFKEKIMAMIN